MKKSIIFIASVLQLLAVIGFIALIKIGIAWGNGQAQGADFAIVLVITVILQAVSAFLRNKYPAETSQAQQIMQKPQPKYGWIALGVFLAAVVIIAIYVAYLNAGLK